MNFLKKLRSSVCSWIELEISDIEVNHKAFTKWSVIILSIILSISVILAFSACKSQQNLVDNSTSVSTNTTNSSSNKADSVRTEIFYIHDTIYLSVSQKGKDSISTSQNSSSSITFAPSGGTYNTKTGEATNVHSVFLSEEFTQLKTSLKETQVQLLQTIEENTSLKDSVSLLNEKLSSSSHIEQQNDITLKEGLSTLQQTFIYIGLVFLIIYIIRILLKVLQLRYPPLSILNKILSWLP